MDDDAKARLLQELERLREYRDAAEDLYHTTGIMEATEAQFERMERARQALSSDLNA